MRSWWRILFVRMIHLQRWADQLNSANKPALCTVHCSASAVLAITMCPQVTHQPHCQVLTV